MDDILAPIIARGPPGIGFNLTKTGDFDLENKKLCNVADAVDDKDAVNLNTLKQKLKFELGTLVQEFEFKFKTFDDNFKLIEEKVTGFNDKIVLLDKQIIDINEKLSIINKRIDQIFEIFEIVE